MRTVEPTRIAKGERIEWTRTFPDYPASDYNLQYRFRGDGPGSDVNATASGDDFVAEIPANSVMAVGRYRWQAWVTSKTTATNTLVVTSGYLTIEPGFTAGETSDIDLRSNAKKIVDAIDAALLVSAGDVIEYEVSTPSGTHRVKRSRKEATDERTYYARIVSNENARDRAREGKSVGTQYKIRMFDHN